MKKVSNIFQPTLLRDIESPVFSNVVGPHGWYPMVRTDGTPHFRWYTIRPPIRHRSHLNSSFITQRVKFPHRWTPTLLDRVRFCWLWIDKTSDNVIFYKITGPCDLKTNYWTRGKERDLGTIEGTVVNHQCPRGPDRKSKTVVFSGLQSRPG